MVSKEMKGYFEIALAAVLFGTVGIFVKTINLNVEATVFYRTSLGGIFLLFFSLLQGSISSLIPKGKKFYLFSMGFLMAITIYAYFTAIKTTSFAVAILLLYTAPVFVAVLSNLFLGEKINKITITAICLSILGVLLMVNPFFEIGSIYFTGIAFGLLSGFCYGLEAILSRYLRDSYTGYAQAVWLNFISALIFLPFALDVPIVALFANFFPLILLGLIPTAISFSLYFNGLSKVKASRGIIVLSLEPISGIAIAIAILGESPSIFMLLGGAAIIASVILVMRERNS
ncbi:MAG: DMT family transporter [Methanocellales archaeon]